MAKHDTNLKSPRRSTSLAIVDGIFARKNFFYDRLPSQPLRLTVLKLDGSCFNIQVSKTATVAQLKDAVEAVFSHVPRQGPAKISWAHVWGQFCLCYDGQKLVTEKDYLRNYGIKDGDQLRFIRHVSNNCCVQRKRLKKRVVYLKQHRRSTQVNSDQPKGNCDDDEISSDDEAIENAKIKHHHIEAAAAAAEEEEEEEEKSVGKNKLVGFVGELFSYTPLAVVRRTRTKSRIWPSTIPRCLLGSFRKIRSIVCFGGKRHYSRRLPWRQ
ncbi:U11/U12 small nuclear ribonucleoprotein 25 kDa protein [Spatholobus suberectus]|nr:U11/U12 small nuclear ribonucleoprotein 25 kDa protein [Spatholobus suberectus]